MSKMSDMAATIEELRKNHLFDSFFQGFLCGNGFLHICTSLVFGSHILPSRSVHIQLFMNFGMLLQLLQLLPTG